MVAVGKDYSCSIHGDKGDFKCQECWHNLERILGDYNSSLIGPSGEINVPRDTLKKFEESLE